MNRKVFVLFLSIAFFASCASLQIDGAIKRYDQAVQNVQLGDSKEDVLLVMEPSQESLGRRQKKLPDQYYKDDVLVEICYFRSGRQPDGLTTNDEFTPFIFNDGNLVGIGWQLIGGPSSQGQVRDTIHVQQNQTVVY